MVQIHVNQTPEEQFLYECPCTSRIDSLTRDITHIYNLQSKIQRLVLRVEERLLANSKDCHPDAAIALKRALSEAKTYVSKDQVLHKKPLSPHLLKDHIQNIERKIMINQSVAFLDSDILQQLSSDIAVGPTGLCVAGTSSNRYCRKLASNNHDIFSHSLSQTWHSCVQTLKLSDVPDTDLLHEDITQLWWAGKELMRDKQLCDYVGKNEKTKIVVRLHSPGSGQTQHSDLQWNKVLEDDKFLAEKLWYSKQMLKAISASTRIVAHMCTGIFHNSIGQLAGRYDTCFISRYKML